MRRAWACPSTARSGHPSIATSRGGCAPSQSAARITSRSTAARLSTQVAAWSVACAAAVTVSRCGGTSPTPTFRSSSSPARRSRSRCSAAGCRPPSCPTRCCRRRVLSTRVEDAAGRVALWRGRKVEVSPLSGGLTNENYLVESEGNRYVMRLPGQSTELLSIDRENEVYNTKAAASTGIGPKVLEHVPGVDVMVLEFIFGPTMSAKTLQSPRMTARMAQSFHRLHAGPRFLHDFNMFRLVEYYLRIVDEHAVTIPDGYRDWLPQGAGIGRA